MQIAPEQRRLAVALALLASLGLPGAAAAQSTPEPRELRTGSTVRFKDARAEGASVEGTYLGLGGQTSGGQALRVRPAGVADTLSVPLDMLRDLHVYRGSHRRTAMGAVIGLIAGATVGGVLSAIAVASTNGDLIEIAPAAIPLSMAVVGGGGALFGAAVGAQVQGERWESIPPPVAPE